MSDDGLFSLLRTLADEHRPAWERTKAGRTLMARAQQKITAVDAEDYERTKALRAAQAQRDLDMLERHGSGEA